jgi:FKBP-type peptidyl-prolyl cis-trans isomerase
LDPTSTAIAEGLQIEDVGLGRGMVVSTGDRVKVHYTGKLADGITFDSSVGREPFTFRVGQGAVIKGWDAGLVGMRIGGKRKLIIPPKLGYGKGGSGKIPPNATLYFEIELLDVVKFGP